MPLYEYICRDCGTRFTLLQSMSASKDGNACPACGKTQTRRLISSFSACGADSDFGNCGPDAMT